MNSEVFGLLKSSHNIDLKMQVMGLTDKMCRDLLTISLYLNKNRAHCIGADFPSLGKHEQEYVFSRA